MVSCSWTHRHCSLRVRIQRSAQPLVSGSPRNAASSAMPSQLIEPRKWPERYWGPQSWRSWRPRATSASRRPQRSMTASWTGWRAAKRSRPWPHGPRPRGVVIHTGEHPHPAVDPGPGHGGIGAPAQVRPVRDDRAVMRPWPAATPDPLGRQQPLPPQQPQDPFPAHRHAVLATKPGPDLAVALASERRGAQHPADERHQVVITDRGGRPRAGRQRRLTTGIDPGARRAEHPAHHRHRPLVFHGYLGHFAGGIDNPPTFFGHRPQDLVLHGQLPDLALSLPELAILGGSVGPLALQAVLAALQKIVAPGHQPVRLHLQLPRELFKGLAATT